MTKSKFKISGEERRKLKKELASIKSYVKNFWRMFQMEKDMYKIFPTDSYEIMTDKTAKKLYERNKEEIAKIEEELSEQIHTISTSTHWMEAEEKMGGNTQLFPISDLSTKLEKVKTTNSKYYIGIDTYDKENLVYSVVKQEEGKSEIIMSKLRDNRKDFDEEVKLLAKVFNADIINEG